MAKSVKSWRLDIQGLRALAVLLVVFYHLRPDLVGGGYIGVDVFFVISGFLITSHMLREVLTSGTIKLREFWGRRIRRLLPAAFSVLLVCIGLTYFLLPKTSQMQNFTEIIAATFYFLNWNLAFNSVDYLAKDNQPSIVQHYWSLSVEEQFYIICPLLILLVVWLARRLFRRVNDRSVSQRSDSYAPRFSNSSATQLREQTIQSRLTRREIRIQQLIVSRAVALLFALIIAISLTYSVYITARSSAAYFVTTTRAWEFASGGLVAVFVGNNQVDALFGSRQKMLKQMDKTPVSNTIKGAILSWVAWLILLGAGFNYGYLNSAFPGWVAAIPVGATAFILWFGDVNLPYFPQKLTHWRPFQLVGDVSYSLYLWHWPVVILFREYTGRLPNWLEMFLLLVLMLALAILSKFYIEDPICRAQGMIRRKRITFGLLAAAMAGLLVICYWPLQVINAERQAQQVLLGKQLKNSQKIGAAASKSCFGAQAVANKCTNPYQVTSNLNPAVTMANSLEKWPIPPACAVSLDPAGWQIFDCQWPALTAEAEHSMPSASALPSTHLAQTQQASGKIAVVGDSHARALLPALSQVAEQNRWPLELHAYMACLPFQKNTEQAPNERERFCSQHNIDVFSALTADPQVKTVVIVARLDGRAGYEPVASDYITQLRRAGKQVLWVQQAPGMAAAKREAGKIAEKPGVCVEKALAARQPGEALLVDPCAWPRPAKFLASYVSSAQKAGAKIFDLTNLTCQGGKCHQVIGGTLVYADDNHLSYEFALSLAPLLADELASLAENHK